MSRELAKKLAADLRRTAAVVRIKRLALEGAARSFRVERPPELENDSSRMPPKFEFKPQAVWVVPHRHIRLFFRL